MGHSRRPGRTARKILSVLRRTVPRHLLQHHPPSKDAFLHRQPDRSLRGHFLPFSAGFLPPRRFRRENRALHQHPPLPDDVLLADLRNYPIHLAGTAIARQIHSLHNGDGRILGRNHDHYPKRALSQAEHTQDGPMGSKFLHKERAEIAADARSEGLAHGIGRQQDTGTRGPADDEEARFGRDAFHRFHLIELLQFIEESCERLQWPSFHLDDEQVRKFALNAF